MNKANGLKIIKKIFLIISILLIILIGINILINFIFKPTPGHKRNISEADVEIRVDINDKNETRTPIIRTYKEEDYKKFDEVKIGKIIDIVSGKVEGDIPAIHLKDEKDIIYVSFSKNKQEITPDYVPDIEIEVPKEWASTAPYNTEENRIIKDKFKKEDRKYIYKLKRYRYQYEKYFMHYNIIRIKYEIDGEKYISILGLNTTNAGEGDSFFENRPLEQPKKPEI